MTKRHTDGLNTACFQVIVLLLVILQPRCILCSVLFLDRTFDYCFEMISLMLASHCPEVDRRWSYECGILKFARNSSRTLTSANQQQKLLRLHSNITRRYQEGITKATLSCDFKYELCTRRRYAGLTTTYDGYTASCYEHDGF